MRWQSWKEHGVYAMLAAYVLLMLILNHLSPMLYWDETAYLGNARDIAGESNFVEEFRYPLLGQLIGVVWAVTGESLFAAKLLMIAFAAAAGYMFYLLCLNLFKEHKHALLGTSLFLASSVMIEWGSRVYTDVAGLALLLAGYYLILTESSKVWKYLSAGLLFGLAFLMRYTYLIFFGLIGMYMIYRWLKGRRLSMFNQGLSVLLGFILINAPWLIRDKIVHKNFFWTFIQQYRIGYVQAAQPWTLQAINIVLVLGPLVLLFIFGAWLVLRDRKEKLYVPVFFALGYAIYIMFSAPIKVERYVVSILPFAVLVAMYCIVCLAGSVKKRKTQTSLYRGTVAVVLLFAVLAGGIRTIGLIQDGQCTADGAVMQSIDFVRSNTENGDVIVSNIWPYYGYHNNLEAYSLWTTNPEKYRTKYHARYVIVHDSMGERFDISALEAVRGVELVQRIEGCDGAVSIYEFL